MMPVRFPLVALVALVVGLHALGGCGAAGPGPVGSAPCSDQRAPLECKDVSYEGVQTSGSLHVLDIIGAQAATEKKAIRKIDEQVERFIAAQRTACDEYNKCLLSADEYKARSEQYSNQLLGLKPAVQTINTGSYGERKQALHQLYTSFVPASARAEHVRFDFGMTATLPAGVGGAAVMLRPGEPLPTNAKVHFVVETNVDSYLYLLQRTGPEKKLEVLFPNPQIGTKNPLSGATPQRIPGSTQHFRVNELDLGIDYIYIVISRKEIPSIQSAFQQVLEGKVKTLDESPVLAKLATMSPGTVGKSCARGLTLEDSAPPGGCSRTRGLVLESETGAGKRAKASAVFATDPGDDVIVKAFPYKHVTEEAYADELSAFDAPTEAGRRSRGVIIER